MNLKMDKLSESEVSIFCHHTSLKDKKHKGERANSLFNYTEENRKM